MQLRPYQSRAVSASVAALQEHESTVLVAPTGAGKTILMAGVAQAAAPVLGGRVLVIQHRDELTDQNLKKWQRVNRTWPVAVFDGTQRAWARSTGFDGAATFAMVQSLANHLDKMQPVDLVMIDECHHVMAPTYQKILGRALELNPKVRFFGVTATPNRRDRRGLGKVFKSVADQITIGELIEAGFLVEPKAHVVEGHLAGELSRVGKRGGEYDLEAVARLIDHEPITQAVLAEWRRLADDRQTIVFAATIDHAEHIAEAYRRAGVTAAVVSERTKKADRRQIIADLNRNRTQVVCNVMALTEGFDCPPISCVMLLRPTAFEGTAVQMIGRGLRTVDLVEHPHGAGKTDCLVLDFGSTLSTLGGLQQVLDLAGDTRERTPGIELSKPCRSCRCAIPLRARACSLCGYEYPREAVQLPMVVDPGLLKLKPVELLLQASPFEWLTMHDRAKIAVAGETWAVVFADRSGLWHAYGGREAEAPKHLACGVLGAALARGDDWMREHGDAAKGRGPWTRLPPTPKQVETLRRLKLRVDGQTRYSAACWITAKFARKAIRKSFEGVRAALEEQSIIDGAGATA